MYRPVIAAVVSLLSVFPVFPIASATGSASSQALVERYRPPDGSLDPVLRALSEGRLERRPVPPLAGLVEPPPVSLGYALAGSELAPFEVSHTEDGRGEVAAFVSRLRRRGEPVATRYRVYALPSIREALEAAPPEAGPEDGPMESALVVPEGTEVGLVGAIFERGQLYVKTTITASAKAPNGDRRILSAPGDSDGWKRAGGYGCIANHQNGTAWYDPCQSFYWLSDDGDPDHQYWAAQYYGTGKSKGAFVLDALQAAGWRSPGSEAQEWVDWNPRSDTELPNCERQSVGVNFGGLEVSRENDHCELWDIDKGREPADFANWWRGEARRTEREISAITATRTKQGESPTDDFNFGYYAHIR